MQADVELDPMLIDIDPQEFQNDKDKIDFFGIYGQQDSKSRLKKSNNKEKVAELLRALKDASCWESAIMKDPHLPYYAMTAYLENKISRDQLTHIEEFYELKLTYPSTYTAPLLTPSGQFTLLVQHILNRMMARKNTKLPGITSEHIEKFRSLLLEYRKAHGDSALVFHFLPSNDQGNVHTGFATLVGAVFESDIGTVMFPISVRYLFLQSITPKNSTVAKPEGKLGPVAIDGIEEKQRELSRVSSVTHPDAYRALNVHEYFVTQTGATFHDIEHLGASNYFPLRLYLAVLLAVDVIRQKTGVKWTRPIWRFIDGYFIDSQACTLNVNIDTVYKLDEELDELRANQWFKNVIYVNELMFYIILDDMQNHPENWNQFISVNNFFEKTVAPSEKEKLTVKTLDEICVRKDVKLQFELACLFGWPVVKNTRLDNCLSVQKQEGTNELTLFIMNEPAGNFDESFLPEFVREISKDDSPILGLFEAAKQGDDTKLSTALQSRNLPTNLDPYLRIALRLAATAGHSTTTSVLLRLIKSFGFHGHYIVGQIVRSEQKNILKTVLQTDKKSVSSALLVALKADKFETFCLLFDELDQEVPTNPLAELITEAFKRNKVAYLRRTVNFILSHQETQPELSGQRKKSFTESILDDIAPLSLRLDTYKESLNELMRLIPGQHPLMMKLFLAILKIGCLETLEFFVNYFLTHSNQTVEDNYLLLMTYILKGLSSVKADNQGGGNLHHQLVKYQIDVYLKFSITLNNAATQNNLPRFFDLNRLIVKIFSNQCELGLHYLLEHPIIKNNPTLKAYCLETAQNVFFQNCECEFAFSKITDKNQFAAKVAEFQQFVTDGVSKLELVQRPSKKKIKKKWHVLSLGNNIFDNLMVTRHRSDRLDIYLNYMFKAETSVSPQELFKLRKEVILFKNFSGKETYYLRQLLAAGLKLNLSIKDNTLVVNDKVIVDNIISNGTQSLLWLTVAVDSVSQETPQPETIRLALNKASEHEEFLREITLLIHNCSVPVKLQTLKRLKYFFDQSNPAQKTALEFIKERIDYLQDNYDTYYLICTLPVSSNQNIRQAQPCQEATMTLGQCGY